MRIQVVYWPQLWPLFFVRSWKDSYHAKIGLKYSVLIGPIEFRIWGKSEVTQ